MQTHYTTYRTGPINEYHSTYNGAGTHYAYTPPEGANAYWSSEHVQDMHHTRITPHETTYVRTTDAAPSSFYRSSQYTTHQVTGPRVRKTIIHFVSFRHNDEIIEQQVQVNDHELDFVGEQGPVKTTEMHYVSMKRTQNLVNQHVEITDHEMDHIGDESHVDVHYMQRPVYKTEYRVVPHYYTTYEQRPIITTHYVTH